MKPSPSQAQEMHTQELCVTLNSRLTRINRLPRRAETDDLWMLGHNEHISAETIIFCRIVDNLVFPERKSPPFVADKFIVCTSFSVEQLTASILCSFESVLTQNFWAVQAGELRKVLSQNFWQNLRWRFPPLESFRTLRIRRQTLIANCHQYY